MDMLSIASEGFVFKKCLSPKGEEPFQKMGKGQIIVCSTGMLQHSGLPAAFLGQKGEGTNEETGGEKHGFVMPKLEISVVCICSIAPA